MPTYVYNILDKKGNLTGKQFEITQSIKADALTKHPETGEPCSRAIVEFSAMHSGPAWNWCESTRRYINDCKPKTIRDDKAGVRMKFPKGGV